MTRLFFAWVSLALACTTAHAAPAVATGAWHSLALHADGTVRTWGDDSSGALGIGRSLLTATPTPVAGLSGVVSVAAGRARTFAVKGDGSLWAWGENSLGELGDGSTTPRSVPVQVVGLTGIVQVGAGRSHTVARKSDGTVWTWGTNYFGELGDAEPSRATPTAVSGMTGVVEIAVGAYHTVARKSDGSVWAWGRNDYGQLGDGTTAADSGGSTTPVRVIGIGDVVQISAGGLHTLARTADGGVWAWGENALGAVGDGTRINRSAPVRLAGLTGVVEISAGFGFNAARGSDGTVWAWGDGGSGQFGDGVYGDHPAPVQIQALSNVSQLALGWLHSLALANDGGLWAWGANGNGQLGDGTTDSPRPIPFRVPGVGGLSAVAVGGLHSAALTRAGTVLTWGDNGNGQLGNATLTFRSVPTIVGGLPPVVAIDGAGQHSIALTADGNVFAWGSNTSDQFQDDSVGHSTPRRIAGLADVTRISAGFYHSVALLRDGTVRAWGTSWLGALGDGSEETDGKPVAVSGLTSVTAISAGAGHSLALKSDGTVWGWGDNGSGQLGDGTTTHRSTPVQVTGIADAVEVAAGPAHSLARLRDGSVVAWGRNNEGQLGDGSEATQRLAPVRVRGLPPGVSALATGRDFSLALADGNVWAWGINYNGGLGCQECDGRAAPVQLPGLTRIAAIASFNNHVLALHQDGSVLAWGDGNLGQIGDGTLVVRESPVVVLREGGAGSVAGNDWFLDLEPAVPTTIPPERIPAFLVVASTSANRVVADVRYRSQDVGTSASTFVFALAPATIVRGAAGGGDPVVAMKARGSPKDTPVQCALAQLNSQGQLVAVSAASLQAYASGVLSAQAQSVNILSATSLPNVVGATFYVGYGANGNAMLVDGKTRSVVSVPGSVSCRPQSPQTGWWWNPAEGGRGFTIEARGNVLFMAAFHYDDNGQAMWNYAGGATSLDGSMFTSNFLRATGGQTLLGTYPGSPNSVGIGPVTMLFSDSTHGTLIWPGGTTPIERLPFVPNGLTTPVPANVPEAGWWWNPQESGRGFFVEWQNNNAHIAGYMYDAAGNPVWYLSREPWTDPLRYVGPWQRFGNGQAPAGPYRPAQLLDPNVGSLTIEFSSSTTGTLTLPNGTRIPLVRQPL